MTTKSTALRNMIRKLRAELNIALSLNVSREVIGYLTAAINELNDAYEAEKRYEKENA